MHVISFQGKIENLAHFATFYVYFGLLVLMFVSNIWADSAAQKPDVQNPWSDLDDERQPLLSSKENTPDAVAITRPVSIGVTSCGGTERSIVWVGNKKRPGHK